MNVSREKFVPISITPLINQLVALRENLRSVLEVFTEACVILAGTKQLPRLFATVSLAVVMVNCSDNVTEVAMNPYSVISPSHSG